MFQNPRINKRVYSFYQKEHVEVSLPSFTSHQLVFGKRYNNHNMATNHYCHLYKHNVWSTRIRANVFHLLNNTFFKYYRYMIHMIKDEKILHKCHIGNNIGTFIPHLMISLLMKILWNNEYLLNLTWHAYITYLNYICSVISDHAHFGGLHSCVHGGIYIWSWRPSVWECF